MKRLLGRLFGSARRQAKRRWQREKKARELGLFGASASTIVDGAASIGVTGVDGMRSDNLGAPDSAYYDDQSTAQFDKAYSKIQKKADSLLR